MKKNRPSNIRTGTENHSLLLLLPLIVLLLASFCVPVTVEAFSITQSKAQCQRKMHTGISTVLSNGRHHQQHENDRLPSSFLLKFPYKPTDLTTTKLLSSSNSNFPTHQHRHRHRHAMLTTCSSRSTRLYTTSKPNEEEDNGESQEEDSITLGGNNGNNSKNDTNNTNANTNVFKKAVHKFRSRPRTYLLIPIIAACVGWLTNYLAVKMIFYPVQYRGIPIIVRPQIPLGLLGWQGIVPCKTQKMSATLVDMVTSQLVTVPEAFERLNPRTLAQYLSQSSVLSPLGHDIMRDCAADAVGSSTGFATSTTASTSSFFTTCWTTISHPNRLWTGLVQFCTTNILTGAMKELIQNSESIFNLKDCVIQQMLQDRAKLGQLFQKVGSVELDFLINSGLWFGFLLGLIQMCLALVWSNPWSLSFGGMVVGLATNWLALKWIFEPINPTKIGPFVIQGMFLTRQKEVAAEFSKFFASKIVTSPQIWKSILNDPTTRPNLFRILNKHITKIFKPVLFLFPWMFRGSGDSTSVSFISKLTNSMIQHLPHRLPLGLHQYVDTTLKLEETLRTQMELMSPAKFERVLHPIFEEDELTLIIAGGVLGFIAGLVQQYIENPQSILGMKASIGKVWNTIKMKFFGRRKINNNKDNNKNDVHNDNGDGVSGE